MTPPLWWFSAAFLGCLVLLYGILRPVKAHCDGCASSGHEVSRLAAINASLERSLTYWITRGYNAETLVLRYRQEEAESEAITARMQGEIMAKIDGVQGLPDWCLIGSKHSPLMLDRVHVDASLSDSAYLSTLSDLVRSTGARL